MELNERLLILSSIACKQPGIGKTAMMKCAYLLQALENVPLGYDFEIYTYGPYSSSVMDEIDFARQNNYLSINSVIYPTGIGYNISCGVEGNKVLQENPNLQYDKAINRIVSVFGGKTAKELELLSTLLFVSNTYKESSSNLKQEVCNTVSKIKPRFSMDEIQLGYDFMYDGGYISN